MGFWFTLFLWAATFVISDYFRAKLPAQEPSGEGDFRSPTATQGRKIPQCVGGTVKINGPNTLGLYDWEAVPVTVETGLIFKRDETIGYTYKVGLVLGQFMGECAGMTGIYVGDDKVWDYVADNAGVPSDVADINLPELFGGETQGGGFIGRVRCFTGADNQPVSSYLLSKNPLQSAWPGLTYVVLTDLTETSGATIGEANQVRDIRVEFQMYDTIANGGLGNELSLTGDQHIIGRDSNPISAAYRVLNHPDFSIGSGDINYTNFQAVAATCFTEGLGYSQVVDSELEAYEILAEIEKHIDGYIGPNPTNGLLEVILARADYVAADEFQATEDNIKNIHNYAKPEWPQTKNEVKVRFVNRDNDYDDDHAVAQDMAGRLIAGRPQSVTIRFPGLRDADAANIICTRTSRAYFWPLAKFQLEMDRTAYAKRPGDVVVVTHSDIGAVNLPARITRVSTGDPVKQTIKLDCVEDVFQFESGITAAPPATEHVPPTDLAVPITNFLNLLAPRWIMELNEQPLETRLLFLVARDIPNNGYSLTYRTRPGAFGGNWSQEFDDGPINTFAKRGTLRGIGSPEVALKQLIASANDGTASVANGGGFQVDGDLADLIGTYNPTIDFDGLLVIDPNGPNEEWCAMSAATLSGGGIECTGVIRGIGDFAIKEHAVGEEVWFIDTGAYLQFDALPGDTDFGYQYRIQPLAPGGAGTQTGLQAEQAVTNDRYIRPNPPTAVIIDQLSTTTWFAEGALDASDPDSVNAPTASGLNFQVWNRRFDQENPIYAANSRNDLNQQFVANFWSDVDPTLKWWLYDLDITPSPSRVDAIASGTELSLDDEQNNKFFDQSDFQALSVQNVPFNCRFEFVWENAASPGIDGVFAGAESNPVFVDRSVTFYPDHESGDVIDDTVLLLHFDGLDRTTQVLDYSPNNHPVTLTGEVQIDTDVPSPPIGSPDQNDGHLIHPAQPSQSPESSPLVPDYYCEVTDISPNAFAALQVDPGFTIQARVRFTVAPSGEIPIVTKWRTSDNERQFWFGLNDTTLRFKHSDDGTAESIETTGTRTWNLNQWYEIAVCVWKTNCYFFVDGVFDENEAHTFGTPHLSAAPCRVGSDGDGNTVPATTYIDEVRIVALPIYKSPYTQQVLPFPGRESRIPLLFGAVESFDDSPQPSPLPDGHDASPATPVVTEDLNRWLFNFGIAEAGSPLAPSTFLDTAQSKWGNASLYMGGQVNTNGGLGSNDDGVLLEGTANAREFEFEKRDFTMEAWIRFASMPSVTNPTNGFAIFSKFLRGGSPSWGNFQFGVGTTDLLGFSVWRKDQTNDTYSITSDPQSPEFQIDTWYHVAVCREGTACSLYADGVRVGFDAAFFQGEPGLASDSGILLGIGRKHNTNSIGRVASFHGWFDDCRILNGVAAYSGPTYTVPTGPFPRDPLPQAQPPAIPSPQSPQGIPSPQSPQGAEEAFVGNPSNWQPPNL